MAFENLISFVNANLNEMCNACVEEIDKSEYMKTYQKVDKEKAFKRHEAVYKHLAKWLESGASNDVAETYFESTGADRFKEGFPLTEVIYAIYITKKVFWNNLSSNSSLFDSNNFEDTIKQIRVLNNYFDLGNFYIIRGYLNTFYGKLDETTLPKEDIKMILSKGAFDMEDLEKDEIIWWHV